MTRRTLLPVLIGLFGAVGGAEGNGGIGNYPIQGTPCPPATTIYYPSYPVIRYQYCEPAPIYVQPAPCLPAPTGPLVPVEQPRPAQPTPAPPSTKEPPLAKDPPAEVKPVPEKKVQEPPRVLESKSFSIEDGKGQKPAPAVDVTNKGVCSVGFWNVSGKDVTIVVEGKTHTVPRDRNLVLPLGREFSWHIEGQSARTEAVPEGKLAYEIVIR